MKSLKSYIKENINTTGQSDGTDPIDLSLSDIEPGMLVRTLSNELFIVFPDKIMKKWFPESYKGRLGGLVYRNNEYRNENHVGFIDLEDYVKWFPKAKNNLNTMSRVWSNFTDVRKFKSKEDFGEWYNKQNFKQYRDFWWSGK
jgi:hypothetical protein